MDIVSPLKQLGKYTAGAAWDTVKSYNDNISTLASDAKEIRDNVIHAGKNSTEIFNDFKLNGMKKFNDWFWQNENEFSEFDLNSTDDDFDAGFQINSGNDNDDDNASMILDARAMKDITRGQVSAMYKIGGKQVEAATMNTAEIVSTINSRSSEIIASVNNVNDSLAKISKQLDYIGTNMMHQVSEEKKSRGMTDNITDYYGKLTVGGVVKETLKEMSQYTGMIDMAKQMAGMMSPRDLIGMGFNYIAEHKFEKLGNKSISDYMEGFNRAFGNKMDEVLSNLLNTDFIRSNTSLNSRGGSTNFRSMITNHYTTDAAKFDGITRQTIIEIIPGYLKSINAALTGQQLEINTKGHLTTDKVNTFADVAGIAMRSSGIASDVSRKISDRIGTLNPKYNSTDVRDAGRGLSGVYVLYIYRNKLNTLDNQTLIALSNDAIDKAAKQLARTNKKHTYAEWTEILRDVFDQICADGNAIREFVQNAVRQRDALMKRAREIAETTTRPQDIPTELTLDMIFDEYGSNNKYRSELDEVNSRYAKQKKELEEKLYEAKHVNPDLIEATTLSSKLNKLKKEIEDELNKVHMKYEDNSSSVSSTTSTTTMGKTGTPVYDLINNVTNSHLRTIVQYQRSLFAILNRGINVRTVGKKPFGSMKPYTSIQNFAQSREEPTTFEPHDQVDDVPTFTPVPVSSNNRRESKTPAQISRSSGDNDSDDGDLASFGNALRDQASNVIQSITKNETFTKIIDGLTGTKIGGAVKGFIDEHLPKNNDGTALTLDASDKNYFDFIRTSISAALSNGNGVEDMGNIQRLIQKVKNPQLRQFLQREVDKILKLNSKKVDAENEKDTDPNMPPEKKPGILGGIAQLFLGKAKSIFAPITMLLKPITSLVNVIAKPLIELAKKGFKSGASDIKAGAKQIWSAMKPKGLPFGKNKDGSTAKSEDYVDVEVDANGNISQKNKTTADAGAAAGVKQPQDKMYPLAPATQTYATNAMNATTGVTTTNNSAGWSGSQSFQFGNSMPIQGGSMQQQQKTVDAKNTGWSGGSYNYQMIQNAPQITTTNKPMSVEKTTANDGAAAGVNNGDDTTKANTKATSKLATVMGGLSTMGLGLVKIITTLVLSLTAVKSAIDLVMRVATRSLQPLNKGINKLIKSIRPVIKSLGKLVSQLSNFVNRLIDSLMGIIQPLMDILNPVIEAIMVSLEPLMQSLECIVDIAVKTIEPLMPMVQLILDNVTTSLNMITNFINEIITPFTEAIQPIIEEFGKIFEPMLTNLQETLEPIRDMISDVAIGVIGPWFADFTSKLVPAIQDISSIFKFFVGRFEIGLGTVENLGGFVVSAFGKLISLLVDDQFGDRMVQAGQKMQESGQQTTKAGQQNVSDALLHWLRRLKIYDAPVEEKKEVDIPEPSPIKSNQTYHGSVMDGLTGSGDPHDQHSYGGFLNMSDHGCGPIALADMAARRNGGVVNAANLALSMAGSGAYSVNSGTSIGSFMDTAASMGMGTQLGGVSAASLGLASPSNPITLIGSGYGFGTRHGNNHYVNVIGTDGNGGAYVSNPLNGRIEVHSASGLASSALAGIYGSGDVGSTTDQIHDLRNATSALTEIGSSTGNTTGIDLGSAVEDAMYDLKQLTSKLLGIFNFDGTFEDKLNKSISDKTQQALADRYESSMTDEEYNAYVEKARALFKQENPKKLFESDKKYEQRFQENLGTYLAKVAGDATKSKKADLMNYSLTTQTNNIEAMYGKYDPESDSYIDEDNGSIVSMVSDVVNSKVGTGFLQTMLKLGGNMVKGLMNMTGIGGLAGTVASAISNIGDVISQNNGNGVDYTTSETGDNGGNGGTNNAVNDPNNRGSMVSSGGVKLGGAGYTPSITEANITQSNNTSIMTPTPIHEFFAKMAGESYAWSNDGNWFSRRENANSVGQGSSGVTHSGVDIKTPNRTTNSVRIYATTDGTVTDTRGGVTGVDHTNHTAGNAVYWKDSDGYLHRIMHLANTTPLVHIGQQIYGGQTLLGYMGNTGDSTGHHTHYDISTPGGQNVNPMTYFQFSSGTTQSDSTYAGNGQSGGRSTTTTGGSGSAKTSGGSSNLGSAFQDLKNRSKQKRDNAKTAFGGGETAEYVWDYLTRGLGLTYEGAAGVMGNLQAESGLRPNNLEDIYEGLLGYTDESYTDAVDSGAYPRSKFISDHKKANCGAGYGLPQFTWHTLKGTLYDKAKAKGVSISDVGVQMETVFETAGETLLNLLKTTTDIKTATERWLRDYEKPANIESALNTRYANAQKIYDQYRYKLSSYYDNAGNPGGYETFNKDGHYDESMSDLVNYLNLVGVVGDNSGSSYSSGCDGYCSPYDSYEPTYSSSGYSPSYSSSGGGGYSSKVSSGGGSSSTTSKPSTSSSPTSGKTIASLPGVKSANARPSSVSEKYTNSGLVKDGMDYSSQFVAKTGDRTRDIDTVTWHVWAGGGDMKSFMPNMTSSARSMSPTYAIDSYGNIAQFADEGRRPWTSGDSQNKSNTNGWKNDNRSITFEIANVPGVSDKNKYANGYNEQYPITPESMQAALDLTVDVARRNGINYFYYTGNQFYGNKYAGDTGVYASPGNFTYHNQFAQKACPGEYIMSQTNNIVKTLNERISMGRGAAIAGLDQKTIEQAYTGDVSMLDKSTQALIDKYTMKRYATDMWQAQSYAAHNNMVAQAEKKMLKDLGIDSKTAYAPSNYTSNASSNTGNSNSSNSSYTIPKSISTIIDAAINGTSSNTSDADKIMNYLMTKQGFTKEGAMGVLANMMYESDGAVSNRAQYNTRDVFGNLNGHSAESQQAYTDRANNGDYTKYQFAHDGVGYGIVQFTYPAWKEMLWDMAQERGVGVDNLDMQLDAWWTQMNMEHKDLISYLQSTDDPITAAKRFMNEYENPGNPAWQTRLNNLDKVQGMYADWNPSSYTGDEAALQIIKAYPNMFNYLMALKTNDGSYIDGITDMQIYNDLVRYGQYFYNAGGGKSDYSWINEVQALSDMYGQTDYPDGWVFQNQSFGLYYENGVPIGQIGRDEYGAWSPIFWSQPTGTKPADTGDKGGAPATSSGDSQKPTDSDSKDKGSKSTITPATTTPKKYATDFKNYAKNQGYNKLTSALSPYQYEQLKSGGKKDFATRLGETIINAGVAAGPALVYMGGVISDQQAKAKEYMLAEDTDRMWASPDHLGDSVLLKTLGMTVDALTGGSLRSINGANEALADAENAKNQEAKNRLTAWYRENILYPRLGMNEDEYERNRQKVKAANDAYYAGRNQSDIMSNAARKASQYTQAVLDYKKAVSDLEWDIQNNPKNVKNPQGYYTNEHASKIADAEKRMKQFEAYAGYIAPVSRTDGTWFKDSNGGWLNNTLSTDYWTERSRLNADTADKNKAKADEQQKQHDQSLAKKMQALAPTGYAKNLYDQALAVSEAAAREGNKTSILANNGYYKEEYGYIPIGVNRGRWGYQGNLTSALNDYFADHRTMLEYRNDVLLQKAQTAVEAYKAFNGGKIDHQTAHDLIELIWSGGEYEYSADYEQLLRSRENHAKNHANDPYYLYQTSLATQNRIQSRKSKDPKSNLTLLEQTIKAIEGNTGKKLTSAQIANYAQMIQNNINPLEQVTNTGVTGTSGVRGRVQIGYDDRRYPLYENRIDGELNQTTLLAISKRNRENANRYANVMSYNTTSTASPYLIGQLIEQGRDKSQPKTPYSDYVSAAYTKNHLNGSAQDLARSANESYRQQRIANYKAAKINNYITDYEKKHNTLLTGADRATFAQIINNGGTPEDFTRYTAIVGQAQKAKLVQQYGDQFVANMGKSYITKGGTEYGSSWTEHYSPLSYSDSGTDRSTQSVINARETNAKARQASTSSGSASVAYQTTRTQQNKTTSTAAKNAKVTNAAARTATTSSNAASIAQMQTKKQQNAANKKKKGSGDVSPSTFTNVEIPPVDLNKLLTPDATTTTTVKSTYTSYNKSNDSLNKILTNTYNVRAKRVEELLESIDKKLESCTKKSNNGKQSTPTPTQQNLFPNNDIPTQIDKLAQG